MEIFLYSAAPLMEKIKKSPFTILCNSFICSPLVYLQDETTHPFSIARMKQLDFNQEDLENIKFFINDYYDTLMKAFFNKDVTFTPYVQNKVLDLIRNLKKYESDTVFVKEYIRGLQEIFSLPVLNYNPGVVSEGIKKVFRKVQNCVDNSKGIGDLAAELIYLSAINNSKVEIYTSNHKLQKVFLASRDWSNSVNDYLRLQVDVRLFIRTTPHSLDENPDIRLKVRVKNHHHYAVI